MRAKANHGPAYSASGVLVTPTHPPGMQDRLSISRFGTNVTALVIVNFNEAGRRAVFLFAKLAKLNGHFFPLLGRELVPAIVLRNFCRALAVF